jgi:hypothetical protein
MSKSRAVENDHPVVPRCQINQAARLEILDHAAIAVKENQRPAIAAFHIVQTNPVDVDELSLRRIIAQRFIGKMPVGDCRRRHNGSCSGNGGDCGIPLEGDQTLGQKGGGTCLRKSHVQYLSGGLHDASDN